MFRKYFQINTFIVLGIIVFVELAFTFILRSQVLTNKDLFDSIAEQITIEDLNRANDSFKSNFWFLLLLSGFKVVVEIFLISVCINLGTLLLRYEINFKQIFGVVTKAYIVFSISRIFIAIVYYTSGVKNLNDLLYLPKLSAFELFSADTIPNWAILPLQIANIFQLGFVLIMAWGFHLLHKRSFKTWLGVIVGTYGFFLILFIILVNFLVLM